MRSLMTLEEFRREMESYARDAEKEAETRRDPYMALDRLRSLYESVEAEERGLADQVLAEWALSEDETVRYDALALITDFKIQTAVPALRTLAQRLASSSKPGAPYEIKKVEWILCTLAEP